MHALFREVLRGATPLRECPLRDPLPLESTWMSIIGRFTRSDDGYIGAIETITFCMEARIVKQTKGANFVMVGPDNCELGAAWRKTGEYGDWLSVRLDGPPLLAPINATVALKPTDDGFYLLRWQRRAPSVRNSPTAPEVAR